MRVLITGANGFVGNHLSRYLTSRGMTCVALDVKGMPEAGSYDARITWDALDTLDLSMFDGVIHLAGKAHDTKNTSDAQSYFDINVGLTKRIVGAVLKCESAKVLKFIFFSSVKACADTVEGVLTEECVPNPQTPYGKSKLEAEGVVQLAVGSGQLAVRTYILRPAMIQGPGNKGNMNLLIKVVKAGIPWPLGAFENKRSFASIENVSRVVEALLTQDVEPGIYQVADDEPLSTNQVIEQVAASLGKKPRIWRLPRGLMRGIARLGDFLHLPLNSERLKKLTESYVVSNEKLARALLRPPSGRNGVVKR